jgi:hypothetical protein
MAEFVVRGLPVQAIEAAVEHLATEGAILCFATAAQIERHWHRSSFSCIPADPASTHALSELGSPPHPFSASAASSSPTDILLVRAPHPDAATRLCAWFCETHGGSAQCYAPDAPIPLSLRGDSTQSKTAVENVASSILQSDTAAASENESHLECGCLDRASGTCLCLRDFGGATDDAGESTCCSLVIRACCCFVRAAPITTLRRRSLLFPIFLDAVSDAYSSSFLAFLLLVRLMLQYNIYIFFGSGGGGFRQFALDNGCNDSSAMNFFRFDVCGELLAGIDVHLGQLAAFLSTFAMMAGNTKWNSVAWLWFSAALSVCKTAFYIILLFQVKDGYAYSTDAGVVTLSHSPLKVLAAMAPLQTLISVFFVALLLEEYRLISKSWRQFVNSGWKVAFFWLRFRFLKLFELCGRTRRRHTETLSAVDWARFGMLNVPNQMDANILSSGSSKGTAQGHCTIVESIAVHEENEGAEDEEDDLSDMELVHSMKSDASAIPSPRAEAHLEQSLLISGGTDLKFSSYFIF